MTKYTADAHALPYPEGVDKVAVHSDIQALATKAGIAISQEGARVEGRLLNSMSEAAAVAKKYTDDNKWVRGTMGNATNINNLTAPGTYNVTTATAADGITPTLPLIAAGVLEVIPNTASAVIQRWSTTGGAGGVNRVFQREMTSPGIWTAWRQMDGVSWEISGNLAPTVDINTLPSGVYHVWSSSRSIDLGLPGLAGGALEVVFITSTAGVQTYTTYSGKQIWKRYNSVGWSEWEWVNRPIPAAPEAPKQAASSGYKVVPLGVTLPSVGNKVTTITERSERHTMGWAAPVTRWRVHIRNGEYRINTFAKGAVSFTGLWFGESAMTSTPVGNYKAAPTRISGAFTSPANGDEWVSPWINKPLAAGTEYLLSYGFTAAAGQELYYHVGRSWATNTAADASAVTGPPGTGLPLFDVWIEAETPATTPTVAAIGDSISCGVGSTNPVRDSWLSIYARGRGALPVHYGGSGDTLSASTDATWQKWTRWDSLARPDAVIFALGSNDIFTGSTLADVKSKFATVAALARDRISPNMYLATVTPRTNVTGEQEGARRQYNTWLRTLPGGARDVFEYGAAVSTDDETITPAYDADGLHFTTAGYTAMAAAITRPVTTPPVMYATV